MGSVPGRTRAACARYLAKVTGLSRAQVTRAITQLTRTGLIEDRRKALAKPFARRYTAADIRLLAEVDARHGTRSGLATRQLCERRYRVFGDTRYARLAGISNGHRYRLRQHPTCLPWWPGNITRPFAPSATALKAHGKSGKAVACAAMRKLIHIAFGVLHSGQPFDPKLALAK